jgi:hypothetical protein
MNHHPYYLNKGCYLLWPGRWGEICQAAASSGGIPMLDVTRKPIAEREEWLINCQHLLAWAGAYTWSLLWSLWETKRTPPLPLSRSRAVWADYTEDRSQFHRLTGSAVAWHYESFSLETFCLFIYFYRSKKISCVEDNDSYTFVVLLGASFAHRIL